METLSVDAWLQPLDGEACGPDLEYDPTFLELDQAAAGKPETQFAPAEPPQWPAVRDLAETLFGRSRDLRLAMYWCRAVVSLDGLPALPAALTLLHGLLDNFWEELHPRNDPDDGDAFARLSVLGGIDKLDSLLGDVRQTLVLNDRRLGGLRIREIEIALDRLGPRADETGRTAGQITGLLSELPELSDKLRTVHDDSLAALKKLQTLMNDRFGIENAIDVKTLKGMLDALKTVLPEVAAADGEDGEAGGDGEVTDYSGGGSGSAPRRGGGVGSIDSRQDAVKAINLVCAYLERHEPTNPARQLLRRAERLIEKDFMQLIRELAPDAMNEVARIMGVDPNDLDN